MELLLDGEMEIWRNEIGVGDFDTCSAVHAVCGSALALQRLVA